MTKKKRQRTSGHTLAKAPLSEAQATEELQDILSQILHQLGPDILENLKKLAKQFQKNGHSAGSGTNSRANWQPEDDNDDVLESEAVILSVQRSAEKKKANHELQDEDEVEDPGQEQNEQANQQPTKKRVMPRVRRSAKRKVNRELRDENEVEEPRQEENEQASQKPFKKQAMAPKTLKATANNNEHEQQQSRQQPKTAEQQSMQKPQPEISEQASKDQGIAKRGPTYLLDVWARKPTEGRILVSFNKRSQPIGPNKKKLTGFLGTLARNGVKIARLRGPRGRT